MLACESSVQWAVGTSLCYLTWLLGIFLTGNRIPGSRVTISWSRLRLLISPEYVPFTVHADRSWIANGGTPGVGEAIASRSRTPSCLGTIGQQWHVGNVAGMAGEGATEFATGEVRWSVGPPKPCRQIARSPCWASLNNRSTSWVDGRNVLIQKHEKLSCFWQ